MNLLELTSLKEKIEKAKTKLAELNGQKDLYMKQLKETFNCSSLEQAEKVKEKLEREIENLEDIIQEKSKELRENYPNLFN